MSAIRINLLPHRQLRKAQQQRLLALLATLIAGAAIAVVLLGQAYISRLVSEQTALNQKIITANAELDKRIAAIASLKGETDDLLARKEVVESLQNNRGETVHIFDTLMRSLPDGLYLTSVKQVGDSVALMGYAQSSARVSNFMSTLNASEIFTDPLLVEVKSSMVGAVRSYAFSLNIKISSKSAKPTEKKGGA
jgi:type IV pilus assembly protein PilN